ncbi:DUF1573 domain-containing protein [Rubrivirga sp.]|uniref:DUF1573 domain-containing protein n=1 Tax=Rubrivirga sp. TaxID=1885344 RepID=UPI003B52FAE6
MKRTLGSLVLLVALASPALAQGRVAFDTETLDLGRIAEADGPVHRTFRFTNAGDAPLRLTSVEAACGCTTPSWTSDPVAPGGSGTVEVAYDPAGRPGDFEKAVFVVAEGADAVTLRISGVVRPALAETGVPLGSLAFDRVEADGGEAPAGEPLQTAFQFANVGDRPVRIERVEAPDGVDVTSPPGPIFPDRIGGLFVSIADPAALAIDGAVSVPLVLWTTDADEPVKQVRVIGRVGPPREIPDGE